jgi:hypothetical protein
MSGWPTGTGELSSDGDKDHHPQEQAMLTATLVTFGTSDRDS